MGDKLTKDMFTEKLRKWLTKETCENLASEAEMRFADSDDLSCYEQMLVLMASGGKEEFMELLADAEIAPNEEDDIEAMFEDMIYEW